MNVCPRVHAGTSLLEAALALALLTALLACLLPLGSAIELRRADLQLESNMAQWVSHIEGFAITRRRLPCPAESTDGVEHAANPSGTCMLSAGFLPWHSVGLNQPKPTPRYAVATLDSLGTPYAQVLTRQDGIKLTPLDLLSSAILSAPDTTGSSPGSLPALLVRPSDSVSAAQAPATPGVACSGTLFLTVSAVAIISAQTSQTEEYANGNRCFSAPPPGQHRRMQWISFERLVWLYLQTGLLSQF